MAGQADLAGGQRRERLVAWARRLIASDSAGTHGVRELAELCVAELLPAAGIAGRLLASEHGPREVTLFAVIAGRDSGAAPLLFNTHLDTVPAGDTTHWTACGGDPFKPTIEGDRIYGLGSADTKLDLVAKLMALAEIGRPRREVFLVGSFGEERGMLGARELAQRRILPAGALAFIGEPSELTLVRASKGLVVFRLKLSFAARAWAAASAGQVSSQMFPVEALWHARFVGRAAHSSTPHLGHNAIRMALAELARRPEFTILELDGGDTVNRVAARCEAVVGGDARGLTGAELKPHRVAAGTRIPVSAIRTLDSFMTAVEDWARNHGPEEPDYPAPSLTWNPGVLRSGQDGGWGYVELEFELRPPPSMAVATVTAGLAGLASELRLGFPELEIDLQQLRHSPGFLTPHDSETMHCGMLAQAAAGLPIADSVKVGATEGGIYAGAGLVPVIFGPGKAAGIAHVPNEYNLLSQVEAAAGFYRALLEL